MPNKANEPSSQYAKTYLHAYALSNLKLSIGFPLDRLKTQLQLDTQLPAGQVATSTVRRGVGELYAGFYPTMVRENIKPLYRTLLITKFPQKLNEAVYTPYHFSPVTQALSSASLAASLDLSVGTPLEVLKVKKMHHSDRPLVSIIKDQMKTTGPKGFFAGYGASFLKSYPAWCNIFLMKQVIQHNEKDQEKPLSYTKLAGYSMLSAAPLTLATTPFDVVKTKQQMSTGEAMQSVGLFKTAKQLVQTEGLTKLFRGFTPRLGHRFMSVFTGLVIMHAHDEQTNKNHPSNRM